MIAIDPGFAVRGRGCACAWFRDGRLVRTWFARPEAFCIAGGIDGIRSVVWECPQVDRRTRASTPAIVQLAAVGGTLAGLYAGYAGARVEPVSPSAWKGSEPKPVCHWRLWAKLDDREREEVAGAAGPERIAAAIDAARRKGALDRWSRDGASYYPASFAKHNLLDAVGIGAWKAGR